MRRTNGFHFCPALVAMTFAFLLSPVLSQAQETRTQLLRFGTVGLARGETARLNVVDLEPPDPDLEPPDPDMPACTVMVSFVGGDSVPFLNASGAPVIREFSLTPGRAAFLDLTPREAFGDNRQLRVQLRGKVEWLEPPDPDTPDPCIGLVGTLEIFDNLTGRTVILYALPPVGLEPPDPDSQPLGQ